MDLKKKLKWDLLIFPILRKDSDWLMYYVHLFLAAPAAGLSKYGTHPSMTDSLFDP